MTAAPDPSRKAFNEKMAEELRGDGEGSKKEADRRWKYLSDEFAAMLAEVKKKLEDEEIDRETKSLVEGAVEKERGEEEVKGV